MEISGFFTAIIIGLFIGALGRIVLPGRQQVGLLMTLLVGIVAAVLGTVVAGGLGVADTPGVDWIELALQVGFSAAGIAAVDRMRGRRAITRR
jgi:uncharacterized membrane protein YeaQ/YmgE (transglycosylase-associated protein family)